MKLSKIKHIGYKELYVRSSQLLSAFAERRGWSSQTKIPEDPAFFHKFELSGTVGKKEILEHFRKRRKPSFFAGFCDRRLTLRELTLRLPSVHRTIVEQANKIVENKFDLLGWRDLEFGSPIDWHFEPVSSRRIPLRHWSRLDYLDSEIAGDKKIVWELNRHQYFSTLGQAYWITDDEIYAATFIAHLNSWMDQNPPKLGINWASSLEVALRSISWLWALNFFRESSSLTEEVFTRILKFLYLNARHLKTYLSTYFSPNTHLTGEALGLFYLGTLLPELSESKSWKEIGKQILLEQLPLHVRPDGVYFEQSSYYHRYTTDFYTHFLILSETNGERLPDLVKEKLISLLDHLMYITRPDGTSPFYGDDDGGRLIKLDCRPANDFRASLSTGAALFHRGDYKYVAGSVAEETLWLLGREGIQTFNSLEPCEPEKKSVAFPDGGYYVMRDGWLPTANYLLFDCGPHGTLNCGHAHADALSFEISAGGQTLLVDPGTYTYTGSKNLRDWFRSSIAHNTLTVGRESSSQSDGYFSWRSIAHAETSQWISRKRFDYVRGRHEGYQRLRDAVIHDRSILFLKNDYWILRDQVICQGEHHYDLWFHLHPNVSCEMGEDRRSIFCKDNGERVCQITSIAEGARWYSEPGWFSESYGEMVEAPVWHLSVRSTGQDEFITFLFPLELHSVRCIEAKGGRALEVSSSSYTDVILLRDERRIETPHIASDFEWMWTRFSADDLKSPEELLLIRGRTLEFKGREVLRSTQAIDYVIVNRSQDQFHIDTNNPKLDTSLLRENLESVFYS